MFFRKVDIERHFIGKFDLSIQTSGKTRNSLIQISNIERRSLDDT